LTKAKKYIIRNLSLTTEWLYNKIATTKVENEPHIPFPQADSFERVINLCEQLNQEGPLSAEQITSNYQFDKRQTDYYFNASRYLGLTEKIHLGGEILITLSEIGQKIMKLDLRSRQEKYIERMLIHGVFKEVLQKCLDGGNLISEQDIVMVMKRHNLFGIISESTYTRRAKTISSWISWIISQLEQ
jgi:hypothetical protein